MGQKKREALFGERISRATGALMNTLWENGLRAEFSEIMMFSMYEHGMQHEGDVTNVAYLGKRGYLLRTGYHLPAGQNPDHPQEIDIFCGIEEPQISQPPYGDGFRLSHRIAIEPDVSKWSLRSWGVSGDVPDIGRIRRDILGCSGEHVVEVPRVKVPLVLARIAQLYMKGA